ncbi:MAG: TonB-dependent receptor plug domain-containing protein, partial [Betaproteobacteria bacterium]|nr:TonB-dependent receptor plug domain-containing protein [Betaproteobacteria bacterium]
MEYKELQSCRLALAVLVSIAYQATAQGADGEQTLATVSVREAKTAAEKVQAPTTAEGATRQHIAETVNVVNTEDAFKYLPNILVRKRFNGDTDAPITSRTTGVNASARSLIYADGVLLSALINNNNGNGSPRWFMVSPEEIERIDVLYGPFSAAFPGNSYGVVAEITTRMPTKFEATAKLTESWQDFKQYGTRDTYRSEQFAATVGNRIGDLAFWFSYNHLDSHSQPVTYGTLTQSTTAPGASPVISGAFADRNRTGAAIQVIGAGNLTHTVQDNAKIKLAYDFTPTLQGAYTFGLWENQADIRAQSYLTTATGTPYYGAAAGNVNLGGFRYSASSIAGQFSAGKRDMEHQMHSLTLKTKDGGTFDWDIALSHYDYAKHQERSSTGVPYTTALGGGAGRILDMEGTGW